MATINFLYRSTQETATLTVRLIHTRQYDIRVSSPIVSKKKYWRKRTTEKGKTVIKSVQLKDMQIRDKAKAKIHKAQLEKFRDKIITDFIKTHNNGELVNQEWLKGRIEKHAPILDTKKKIQKAKLKAKNKKRKAEERKEHIFNKNLLTKALEHIQLKYETNDNEKKKYKSTLSILNEYEEYHKKQFKIKDLSQNFADNFMNWAHLDMRYEKSYVNSILKRLRKAALYVYENDEEDVVNVSKTIRRFTIFKDVYKEKVVITLNYEELDKIDNTQVPEYLLDAKKSILIGCETGLRYSDFNKLTDVNIKNIDGVNYWKFRTEKTNSLVLITISDRIIYLIEKYGLPTTTYPSNGVKLNRDIKEVCLKAKINEKIYAKKSQVVKVNNKNVIRKISALYPKHELITTRTFRRSFATNYYGKIDTPLIMKVTGHTTEKVLKSYINVSDTGNITNTKQQIDNYHEKRKEVKKNTKFTVIPKIAN